MTRAARRAALLLTSLRACQAALAAQFPCKLIAPAARVARCERLSPASKHMVSVVLAASHQIQAAPDRLLARLSRLDKFCPQAPPAFAGDLRWLGPPWHTPCVCTSRAQHRCSTQM